MDTIFDYKRNQYLAQLSTEELLDKMATRPDFMISCLGVGTGCAAGSLARSIFRVARELEHRGFRIKSVVDAHPLDICACGDYRRDHGPQGMLCRLNGLGHSGLPSDFKCLIFSLDQKHAAEVA